MTAFSLPLLTNVAMAWNTGYVQKILQARKEEGYGAGGEPPNEKDFDRVVHRLPLNPLIVWVGILSWRPPPRMKSNWKIMDSVL